MSDAPPAAAPSLLMRLAMGALGLAALAYASVAASAGRFDFGALYGGSTIAAEGALAYLAVAGAGLFGFGAVVVSVRGAETPKPVALGALAGALLLAVLWLLAIVGALTVS